MVGFESADPKWGGYWLRGAIVLGLIVAEAAIFHCIAMPFAMDGFGIGAAILVFVSVVFSASLAVSYTWKGSRQAEAPLLASSVLVPVGCVILARMLDALVVALMLALPPMATVGFVLFTYMFTLALPELIAGLTGYLLHRRIYGPPTAN